MAIPHAVLHSSSFPPCDLLHVWSGLSQGVRDTLVAQGVNNAVLLKRLFDGREEDAVGLVAEFGVVSGDVLPLLVLWQSWPRQLRGSIAEYRTLLMLKSMWPRTCVGGSARRGASQHSSTL